MTKMCAFVALGVAALAGSANAGIIGTSGAADLIAAPADARINALVNATRVHVWNEQQNHTLASALRVNAINPGLYNSTSDLVNASISAGTAVASHYIHFDSPGGTSASATGSVTFDADILGVICLGDSTSISHLDDSDFLSSGTLYSNNVANRGLELSNNEFFRISADRRTVEFSFRIGSPGDFMRVVTMVPTPGSAALAVVGFGMLARRRRSV